jgi:hypothetical protein
MAIRNVLNSRLTEGVIRVLVLVSFFGMIYVGGREYILARCLATYDNAVAKVNAQRIAAADQDRSAQDALFRSIAQDPRAGVSALQLYNEQRAEANKTRAANTLPSPPSQRC